MAVLVTGGTGFLGQHVVELLQQAGEDVVVLARGFDVDMADRGVTFVSGSATDPEAVATALQGVDRVFHLAGMVERDRRKAHRMYSLHVDGTRILLQACADAGVRKIVVASTSGTVGVGRDPDFMGTEESPTTELVVKRWPYYLSKIYAERVCRDFERRHGLPIVLMRPTLLLGPGDWRQSSTGDVVLYMKRRIPTILPGGLSFVDVRDTAAAFIKAMERAPAGESYLLGAANMTLAAFFEELEDLTAIPGPKLPLPNSLALRGAKLLGLANRLVDADPVVDAESVEMAKCYWYIDSSKAERDLGWNPRPARLTLRDTVRWIERHHPDFAKPPRTAPPSEWLGADEPDVVH